MLYATVTLIALLHRLNQIEVEITQIIVVFAYFIMLWFKLLCF